MFHPPDPVVASDGQSYERTAIEQHMRLSLVSPFSREPLQRTLFPNRNLRKRIEDHDKDLLNAVETSRKAAAAAT